ncbi:diacylglycerol acyltransferase domain-containing protein [Ditylenchus destructor]|uniref:Acyltransferase n=1 Tax=Ditylenchus destructor TaxID=166010 RepID=A0AAD4RDC6_9BILA|nr:diacylglycerol acyltransferase domain-containing protein [Ditylenchus destructor]
MPLDRYQWIAFLQTLAVFHHIFLWIIMPFISLWLPIYVLLFSRFWWVMAAYFLWYLYDFGTPAKGSRSLACYKNSPIWNYFADYFPISIVKTSELPPDRNYLMGCHPHGILSIGAFTHLCTNATGFSDKFPGLKSTILTLSGQFWFPLRREFGIALGGVESSNKSLRYLLQKPGYGRLIGIVIGGAEEALDAKPGVHDLNIMNRRGFCRHAIQMGAYLVPSYSFGENEIFDQKYNARGSPIRKVQTYIKKQLGFCPPLFTGRGFFSENFGLLPYRKPITTIVGAPISVEKCDNPTLAQIDALHVRYCESLRELFEEHKAKYGVPENVHLNLL